MTSTLFFQLGLLVILAAFALYAIPTLIQVRRTAKAVEEMVHDVRPRLVGATTSLDSVLGRTDRVMEGLEKGSRGITGAVAGLGSFLSNLKMPLKGVNRGPATMAALANFLSGAWQAWAVFTHDKDGAKPGAGKGAPDAAAPGEPEIRPDDGGSSHGR